MSLFRRMTPVPPYSWGSQIDYGLFPVEFPNQYPPHEVTNGGNNRFGISSAKKSIQVRIIACLPVCLSSRPRPLSHAHSGEVHTTRSVQNCPFQSTILPRRFLRVARASTLRPHRLVADEKIWGNTTPLDNDAHFGLAAWSPSFTWILRSAPTSHLLVLTSNSYCSWLYRLVHTPHRPDGSACAGSAIMLILCNADPNVDPNVDLNVGGWFKR